MTRSNLQPKTDGNWYVNTFLFFFFREDNPEFCFTGLLVGPQYEATPLIIAFFPVSQCDCVWRWGL